ncbi:MAG: peptide ABC transporter permease [Chloroflexi bacterium]|nr:MAG: peptide ABC transporter permease [Chloroflexota bacterium]
MASTTPEQALQIGAQPKRQFRYRLAGRFLREPSAVFAGVVLAVLVLAAVAAPLLAPYNPNATDLRARNIPPAWQRAGSSAHWLGTDPVGRDILSRIIYGARVSLSVGLIVTALAAMIGVLVGLLAGYYEGWIDEVVMRLADLFLAFPFILLAITIIAVLGSGLTNLILVLVITGWVQYARLVRGLVYSIKRNQYVEAALVAGAVDRRVILRHILPNTLAPVVVLATLQVAFVLLTESALNFLGLGVNPTIPTWGSMVNEGRLYIYNAWWVITFPGVAIMLAVLSINMLGDWLRDVFDPTLRVV